MKKLVLFIPGNPSVPGVYDPFKKVFESQLDCHMMVLPHLGQGDSTRLRFQNLSLHHVIEDHRQNIQKMMDKYQPKEVILMGHSLGSAIVVQLYEDFKNKIDHFTLLMPFLGPSGKNKLWVEAFKNSVSNLYLRAFSNGILINEKISQAFMRKMVGEKNQFITNQLRQPHYLHHFFSLLSSYKDVFEELNIREKIGCIDPRRSFYLFAKEDFWAPLEFVHSLPPKANYIIENDISHDFCLDERHYKTVSNRLVRHHQKA